MFEGLPSALQAAILDEAPSSNISALLGILPFWMALSALNAHASTISASVPGVRTWLEGIGLHLSATFGASPGDGRPCVTALEVTGLAWNAHGTAATRPAYRDRDMAAFLRSICEHDALQELSLNGVRLGAESAAELRRGLPTMHALQRLEVCNAGISVHDCGPALASLAALESLHLSHIRAGPGISDIGLFAAQVGRMRNLTALSLTSCKVGEDGWREVLSKVAELPHLRTLTLERNRLLADSLWAALVGRGSHQLWPSLEALSLCRSRGISQTAFSSTDSVPTPSSVADPAPAPGLVAFLQSLTGLTSLSLAQAGMSGEGAAEVIAPLRRLRSLNLMGNRISAAGMRSLAPQLPYLEHLTNLDLSLNQLGDAGAAALAEFAPFLHQLEVCKLCSNDIGDDGARDLFAAVQSTRVLRDLSLVMNAITDAGVAAFVGALPQMRSLECMHLHHNAVGRPAQESAQSVAAVLGCTARF